MPFVALVLSCEVLTTFQVIKAGGYRAVIKDRLKA